MNKKGDRKIRQLGFQETDIVSMALPVTKQAWRIEHENQIAPAFREAFKVAVSGRPGPVLIDIPMNVQRAQIYEPATAANQSPQISDLNQTDAETIRNALLSAKMPMILAGGGIRGGNAIQIFREFIELASIPVVHSLMAVDVLPFSHPLNAGMIGSYGNRWLVS